MLTKSQHINYYTHLKYTYGYVHKVPAQVPVHADTMIKYYNEQISIHPAAGSEFS